MSYEFQIDRRKNGASKKKEHPKYNYMEKIACQYHISLYEDASGKC